MPVATKSSGLAGEIVAAGVDVAGADNVFDTKDISLRRYRRHSLYAASNKTVSSGRSYV